MINVVLEKSELRIFLEGLDAAAEHQLCVPYTLRRRGVEAKLILDPDIHPRQSKPDPALIKGIAKAYMWNKRLLAGDPPSLRALARAEGVTVRYIQKMLPLAFISPSLVSSILRGYQPPEMTLESLVSSKLARNWREQSYIH